MGYCSTVVIGVSKRVLARGLLDPTFAPPAALNDVVRTDTGQAVYWHVKNWKWYDSYPEIQEIEAWFALMGESELPEEASLYGAIRIGEDDGDIQIWGAPWEFDIHLQRTIDFPQG